MENRKRLSIKEANDAYEEQHRYGLAVDVCPRLEKAYRLLLPYLEDENPEALILFASVVAEMEEYMPDAVSEQDRRTVASTLQDLLEGRLSVETEPYRRYASESLASLAVRYLRGTGVAQSVRMAKRCYEKSYQMGFTLAKLPLEMLFHTSDDGKLCYRLGNIVLSE